MYSSILHRLGGLRGWRAMAAASALGVLSALALPPLHVIPVLLVAVPGLLVLLARQPGWRGAALAGFWFGFGHHVVGLYWITEAIMIEAARYWWLVPLAVPALAAVLALFIAAPCALARWLPVGWRRVLVLAGGWVLADIARQFVATGFPWNPWGSVWAIPGFAGDMLLQPAALAGVHGLTLATVLLAATPALGRRAMAAGAACLAVWCGFGLWRLDQAMPPAPGLAVLLVQGNVPQGQKWDRAIAADIFARYLALTRQAVAASGSRAVVIWPETASPYLVDADADARAMIADAARGPGGEPVPVLVGSVRFDAARRPRNSLMAVVGPHPPAAVYDKWHLVPFGEYQPGWMPLAIQLVPGGGFRPGPGPVTLRVPGVPPFAPLICYEVIFSGQVVAADRPEWIVTVTNDAWFGNSAGPRQHLAAARLRAVEEGLPLARAANTGISAAYDPYGRELGRLGMAVTGILQVNLPGRIAAPLFARVGLWVPAAAAALLLLFGFGWPRYRAAR